ncbi:nucleotidyltransferase family protein [uncultured Sneathiella sp.]|uniref:nucleotidyltransferase family protein n=1 Tax=uncultured Sneathiella sp. TaxID=879315 RepID=UPI0030EF316A|tara:strand:- start:4820 stop:5380 length:561 start_codon:yes stop_codon:yes gene_type:complete
MLLSEADILDLVRSDSFMMAALEAARALALPDWMIGAGFVRNKVWDHLHGYPGDGGQGADIDLIYFDPLDISRETEKAHDDWLRQRLNADWSVKNQARMHIRNGRAEPYRGSRAALSDWLETPTCVAVHLDAGGELSLIAPHGIRDLVELIVRPSLAGKQKPAAYQERLAAKNWQRRWPKLRYLAG